MHGLDTARLGESEIHSKPHRHDPSFSLQNVQPKHKRMKPSLPLHGSEGEGS